MAINTSSLQLDKKLATLRRITGFTNGSLPEDSDIVGTAGFESLVRRLKDGNNLCKEIEEFLKNRFSAEKDYASKLQKHSQTAASRSGHESDGLCNAWDEFIKQSEAEAGCHLKSANAFLEVSKRIETFRANQGELRKRLEDGVKRLQNQKNQCYKSVLSSKEKYECKCKELDSMNETLEREKPMAKPADMAKLYLKLERIKRSVVEADETYKRSVEQLEEKRKEWEASMTSFCHEAQKLEVERILYLRDQLWESTNHVSQKCVEADRVQELVRKVLETCQANNDLQLFVQQKRTGNKRPEPIPYQQQHKVNGRRIEKDSVEYQDYYRDSSTATKLPSNHHHLSDGSPTPSGHSNISRAPLPTIPKADYGQDMNEGIYSSVPDSYLGGGGGNKEASTGNHHHHQQQQQHTFRAKATYQYIAQSHGELSLHPGQMVTVLSNADSNWWLVKINNQEGNVPSRFLEPVRTPRILV